MSNRPISITDFSKLLQGYRGILPIPIVEIAIALGLKVYSATLPSDISGFIKKEPKNDGYMIVVNKNQTNMRKRYTIAHEIAHFILHFDKIEKGIVDREDNKSDVMFRSESVSSNDEYAANKLAADILMPIPEITKLLHEHKPKDLASIFQVSEQAMRIRLEQL